MTREHMTSSLSWQVRSLYLAVFCISLSACGLSGFKLGEGIKGIFETSSMGTKEALERQELSLRRNLKSQEPVPNFRRQNLLPSVNLDYTKEVDVELRDFLRGGPSYILKTLERREEVYPILSQIFIDEGIPLDLLNLALIESGFRNEARSSSGAQGLWQFTKGTARSYGLEVGWLKDQRKDPILSSIAAAKHLRDLYQQFKDWYLVLAAYNAGSGAIVRAIKKTGSTNFWNLAKGRHLHSQTKQFVPRFIAATFLVNTLDELDCVDNAAYCNLQGENLMQQVLYSVSSKSRISVPASTEVGIAKEKRPIQVAIKEGCDSYDDKGKRVQDWPGNRCSPIS